MSAVANMISQLESEAGIRQVDIANIVNVSKATISRWRAGRSLPSPANEHLLAQLNYITLRLRDYYEADEVRLWLRSPHPQLDGKSAIELINGGQFEQVLEVIHRLDGDAYL